MTADWNRDGLADRAQLVEEDDSTATLVLFLSDKAQGAVKPAVRVPAFAFSGLLEGMQPELKVTPQGSLQVISQNNAISRDRWTQIVTIIYRNHQFRVAGLTYYSYDTLDPNAGESVDINLLTGQVIKNNKKSKISPQKILVTNWNHRRNFNEFVK